jgi:Fe-S cluster biogenesis protein NfuA
MIKTSSLEEKKQRVREVLHNLNWLLESHNSYAELVEIQGNNVIVRTTGACAECETGCVETAFRERMPDITLIQH